MKLNTVIIGVGSNINPDENIRLSKEAIASEHELVKSSSFVRTEPIGFTDQKDFINGAFLIETEMGREELTVWLKRLEDKLGRVRNQNRNGPRTIDLDIIVWNGSVVDSDVFERPFLRDSIKELLPGLRIG